jgi:hypothetical protein
MGKEMIAFGKSFVNIMLTLCSCACDEQEDIARYHAPGVACRPDGEPSGGII